LNGEWVEELFLRFCRGACCIATSWSFYQLVSNLLWTGKNGNARRRKSGVPVVGRSVASISSCSSGSSSHFPISWRGFPRETNWSGADSLGRLLGHQQIANNSSKGSSIVADFGIVLWHATRTVVPNSQEYDEGDQLCLNGYLPSIFILRNGCNQIIFNSI